MYSLDRNDLNFYVNEHIADFHRERIESLEEVNLEALLRGNPYLLRARNILTAGKLIAGLIDDFLVSLEEKFFAEFLKNLAVFIAGQTCNGRKSAIPGVDLEFEDGGIYYIVSIKGDSDGDNISEQGVLTGDLHKAAASLQQSCPELMVKPVVGSCYGEARTDFFHGCLKVAGQNFWYLISRDKCLYADIIESVGFYANKHAGRFDRQKAAAANRLTAEFVKQFCDEAGMIDWEKLVAFHSGNFDLDKFDDAVSVAGASFGNGYDPTI